jgi:hypothetical protein
MTQYNSHSLLFALDQTEHKTDHISDHIAEHISNHKAEHIYAYDPDDQQPINAEYFLDRRVINGFIDQPIQSITDDIYCIFHSLFAMFDMINIQKKNPDINLASIVNLFEQYQNTINKSKSTKIKKLVGRRVSALLERYPPQSQCKVYRT